MPDAKPCPANPQPPLPSPSRRFLALGECMVELAPRPDGSFQQGFAGDVFNTAWYAAQLFGPDWHVHFHTALGTDPLSDALLAFAHGADIDCGSVLRLSDAMPGLYMIRLAQGERNFLYWRGQSAARRMLEDRARVADQMRMADVVYLSGITLAVLPPAARAQLVALMAQARAAGAQVVFDPNIRPSLWSDAQSLRSAVMQAARAASIVLPSFADEAAIFTDPTPQATAARYRAAGAGIVVVKDGPAPVLVATAAGTQTHDTPPLAGPVIDTTAAGDAFNAGFLATYLRDHDPGAGVRAGQAIAAQVVQGRGALVALDGAVARRARVPAPAAANRPTPDITP
ncbi:MAG: sugar kinase [Roseinatronobacter sp.]